MVFKTVNLKVPGKCAPGHRHAHQCDWVPVTFSIAHLRFYYLWNAFKSTFPH